MLVLLALASGSGAAPVIFDTDMDTDCDDAGALAVLHALADRGECEILGTMVSVRHASSAPCVAAINAYYGRASLPLGAVKSGGVDEPSTFAGKVAAEFAQPGLVIADAVELYREILGRQPDHSVVVVTVGYLTNLARLLEQPGGRALVERKVARLVCMGGNFIGSPPHDDLKLGNVNFQRDPASALRVVREWPGTIEFVGREIGSVPSGLSLGACLVRTPPTNPVRRAYEHYFGGALRNRHVADLTTVLYAVRGVRDYWEQSPRGSMDLQADMTFDWKPDPNGRHTYVLKVRPARDRAIEAALEELLLQPPRS